MEQDQDPGQRQYQGNCWLGVNDAALRQRRLRYKKWQANSEGDGKNNQLKLLKQAFDDGSLVFNNVSLVRHSQKTRIS